MKLLQLHYTASSSTSSMAVCSSMFGCKECITARRCSEYNEGADGIKIHFNLIYM
jgi:hypothetical protein